MMAIGAEPTQGIVWSPAAGAPDNALQREPLTLDASARRRTTNMGGTCCTRWDGRGRARRRYPLCGQPVDPQV